MADTRFHRDQRIRNAVEAFTNLASSSKESVEEAVLSAAYGTLCSDDPRGGGLVNTTYFDPNLARRAVAAYFRSGGTDQPQGRPYLQTVNGLTYIVLRNITGRVPSDQPRRSQAAQALAIRTQRLVGTVPPHQEFPVVFPAAS
jgi:hypothetical protein